MAVHNVPPRIRWAVEFMKVQPNDRILEIGSGPGYASELICPMLEKGSLFAIYRSEAGVDRTKRRNPQWVEAGKLTARQIDLATLRVPVKRLNKAFAMNVNLFWTRDCSEEVAMLHSKILPGGRLFVFYEVKEQTAKNVPEAIAKTVEALEGGGFTCTVAQQKEPHVLAIVGQK